MMPIIRLVLAVLTSYRLAVLFSQEDGPLFVFARLRDFVDSRRYDRQQGNPKYAGFWASLDEGLRCAWCVGVWAAALCAVLVWRPTVPGDVLLTWLGIAGAALFLERLHE